jgi:hypothetical protein
MSLPRVDDDVCGKSELSLIKRDFAHRLVAALW